MVISAEPYPGWAGKVGSQASERVLGIDLNDNVPLDEMTVSCLDPSLAPTHFVLQTSMNGRDWSTRGPLPGTTRRRGTAAQALLRFQPIATASRFRRRRVGICRWIGVRKMEQTSARESCRYLAAHVPNLSAENLPVVDAGHPGYPALLRYRAYFYQPAAAVRTFQLAGLPPEKNTQTVFLIDGRPAEEDAADPFVIEREIRPGLHEIQVWRNESRSEFLKRKPQLLCNVEGQDELIACPDEMFDPDSFPAEVRKAVIQPAVVKANDTGTEFAITFG